MDLSRRKLLATSAMASIAGCGSSNEIGFSGDSGESSEQGDTDGTGETGSADASEQASEYFAGSELVAIDVDGTARILDGRDGAVLYEGDDIGVLINQLQDDFPGGVHLHLAGLFEYSTPIVVDTALKLTGERAVARLNQERAFHKGVEPTGLHFTGDGKAVRLFNGEQPVRHTHLEDLTIHVESGTVGLEVADGGLTGEGEYSPFIDCRFRNIVVQGGTEAGIRIQGTFLSEFDGVRAYGCGGHGIQIKGATINRFGLLRAKLCEGDGIRVEKSGSCVYQFLYTNFVEGDGIVIGPDVDNTNIEHAFAESNGGAGVRVDALISEIGHLRGWDNTGTDVVLENVAGTRIGGIQSHHTGVRLEQLSGTDIGMIKTSRSGIDVSDAVFKGDVTIRTVDNPNGGPSSFNSGTVSADGDGRIFWNFDTLFTNPPMLQFGRRGGGIEQVQFRTDDAGFYFGATIDVSDANGTIDVRAAPNGNTA